MHPNCTRDMYFKQDWNRACDLADNGGYPARLYFDANYLMIMIMIEITCILERGGKMSGATICYTYFIFLIFFYYLLCKASDNFQQLSYRLRAKV